MNIDTSQLFAVFGVETALGVLGLLLLAADLLTGKGRLTGPAPAVQALGYVGLGAILAWTFTLEPGAAGAFGTLDAFALFFKRFFVAAALLTLAVAAPYDERLPAGRGEFTALLVFTTMGMCLLASAHDFVTLFVGLELVTVTLFLMAAYRPRLPRSIEAGIKFVVIGALAAAFMVYGIAFVYGTTGSFEFARVAAVLRSGAPVPGGLQFGLLMVLVGLGFKIGAVPFHVWIPDVYQGSPTPTTAFLSVGSKAAGVVLLMRVVYGVMGPAAGEWTAALAGLAALTLVMGGLGAIPQTELKRFLGYSGISHAGFLLVALAAHTEASASAILFYVATYLFANIAAFGVVVIVSRTDDDSHMDRIDGLADRSPFLALVLTASMLSLAGVPPFAGFFAKFMVLRAAVDQPGLLWLVVLSLVMALTSLYYYLCLLKRMYMRTASDTGLLEISGGSRLLMLLCTIAVVALGIYQQPLVAAAEVGARSLF